jgi:hypothetical protein
MNASYINFAYIYLSYEFICQCRATWTVQARSDTVQEENHDNLQSPSNDSLWFLWQVTIRVCLLIFITSSNSSFFQRIQYCTAPNSPYRKCSFLFVSCEWNGRIHWNSLLNRDKSSQCNPHKGLLYFDCQDLSMNFHHLTLQFPIEQSKNSTSQQISKCNDVAKQIYSWSQNKSMNWENCVNSNSLAIHDLQPGNNRYAHYPKK